MSFAGATAPMARPRRRSAPSGWAPWPRATRIPATWTRTVRWCARAPTAAASRARPPAAMPTSAPVPPSAARAPPAAPCRAGASTTSIAPVPRRVRSRPCRSAAWADARWRRPVRRRAGVPTPTARPRPCRQWVDASIARSVAVPSTPVACSTMAAPPAGVMPAPARPVFPPAAGWPSAKASSTAAAFAPTARSPAGVVAWRARRRRPAASRRWPRARTTPARSAPAASWPAGAITAVASSMRRAAASSA